MRTVVLLVSLLIAVAGAVAAAAEGPRPEIDDGIDDRDDLLAFLATYRCGVVERLRRIHENQASKTDRYFIIALKSDPQSYVQCIFLSNDTQMLCEASSGYYRTVPEEQRTGYLRPSSVAELARLGFLTDDTEGNFQRFLSFHGEPNYRAIADLVLMALFKAYGARIGSQLEWKSPLAFFPSPESECPPFD